MTGPIGKAETPNAAPGPEGIAAAAAHKRSGNPPAIEAAAKAALHQACTRPNMSDSAYLMGTTGNPWDPTIQGYDF